MYRLDIKSKYFFRKIASCFFQRQILQSNLHICSNHDYTNSLKRPIFVYISETISLGANTKGIISKYYIGAEYSRI